MSANTVPVILKVEPRAYERLSESATAKGYKPAVFAKLLFDAAFAARIGQEKGVPASDRELDEQVRLVFACAGQADAKAIARATGVAESRVTKILDGFRQVMGKGRARA